MTVLALLLLLAQTERIKCTTVGETRLGQGPTTAPLQCCPKDFYLDHVDERGKLVCVRET